MRFSNELAALGVSLVALVAVTGCGSDNAKSEPTCLPAPVSTDCAPQYEPTFQNVFTNTLSRTCAANSSCHAGSTPQAGMALDEIEKAYTNLVNTKSANGEARVTPKDVQCGKVMVRLESENEPWSMPPPPGHLMPTELCSIVQWIANGAAR